MTVRRRRFLQLVAAAAAAPVVPRVASALDYPTRAVTIIVPFTPAGSTDILGRLVGRGLEQRLGGSFPVENRPGAGTQIGATELARSLPDGYTLMVAPSTTMAVNVTLYKKLSYDPRTDFIPLGLLAKIPFVLVVNPSLPVHSVRELIAYATSRPGELSYASGGVGAAHHLCGALLMSLTGIKMTHVPYKGSAPAVTDVVAGQVPLMFSDFAPALGFINAGKLRALGVTTDKRVAAAPDIPTIAEAGVPGFEALPWQMIVTRAGTPQPIVERLNSEVKSIMTGGDVPQQLTKMGMVPAETGTPDGLKRFVESEIVRWGKIVQIAGVAGYV
jgi:tripartite-type tricarboxylate transporter receptor subunit TctC